MTTGRAGRRLGALVLVVVLAGAGAVAARTNGTRSMARSAATGTSSGASVPTALGDQLPVFSPETPAGDAAASSAPSHHPARRRVDGDISDWIGRGPGVAGTTVYSAGELIYTDHLFDAWGADDGRDARRLGVLDPVAAVAPETYRLDALQQADVPGELGAPTPQALAASEHYGDAPDLQDVADLTELRVADDGRRLWVLGRTTTMTAPDQTALLVLLDTAPGDQVRDVPFNSGLRTTHADRALLLAGGQGWLADLGAGTVTPLPAGSVATNPAGWTNAIEAAVPLSMIGAAGHTHVGAAAATGRYDGHGGLAAIPGLTANVANVAFRNHEPVRVWFDKQQALSLYNRSIDGFFTDVDLTKLSAGTTEPVTLPAGYYERIFTSSATISAEHGVDGILQDYGVYVPTAYRPGQAAPLTFWLHWRGGTAHSAAAWTPRVMKEFGEDRGGLVVSPRGRGTASWYVGKGMEDFQEVWDDVLRSFSVDRDRVYVTGHSMGGWGSYLMSMVFPDRFAAAVPVSPPVTQGAFTGADLGEPCDQYHYQEYSFCYVQANGGDARAEHTLKLVENLRNTPIAIYAGGIDELVPFPGEVVQANALRSLGYRYRLYDFPTYEHYTPPVVDQWSEFARFMDRYRRPDAPARVTYVRDMPFEHAVDNGPDLSEPAGLSFHLDRAWWMSDLTPVDPIAGAAHFDGRSLAIPDPSVVTVPEAGGPTALGQTGPFVMSGQTWMPNPLAPPAPAPTNGFDVTLRGVLSVRLDLTAMALRVDGPLSGTVTTDHATTLTLAGPWSRMPTATIDGAPTTVSGAAGAISVTVPAGHHGIVLTP